MLANNLKRLRPFTPLFLTAAALVIGVACGPSDDAGGGGTTPQPIGGGSPTGGAGATPGAGSTPGGLGTVDSGVVAQGGTPGGQAGAQAGTPGGQAGAQAGTPGGQAGAQAGTPGGQAAGDGGAPPGGGATGGDAGTPDAGGGTPGGNAMAMNFPGKATGCSSYGAAMLPGKCAGYYCNISLAQLEPALGTSGKCTGFTAMDVCEGLLTKHVGECAREQKSANPLASNAELRPKVEACVRAKRDYTKVTPDCMGCFLDAATCAGDKCLIQCLVGDSPDCDKCRMDNKCNQPVPACGGLPNPF